MNQKTYRNIDVFILTAITCVLEAVNILAVKKLFPSSLFSLSVVIPMTAVVILRWRGLGAFTVVAAGLVYCVLLGAVWQQYLIYSVGSGAVMLNLLWFKITPYKKIEGSLPLLLGFLATAFVLANVGRAAAAITLDPNFFGGLKAFLMSDLLNILIGGIIIFTASRQKSFLQYQPDYLKRLDEEKKKREQAANALWHDQNN